VLGSFGDFFRFLLEITVEEKKLFSGTVFFFVCQKKTYCTAKLSKWILVIICSSVGVVLCLIYCFINLSNHRITSEAPFGSSETRRRLPFILFYMSKPLSPMERVVEDPVYVKNCQRQSPFDIRTNWEVQNMAAI
jgi:hypothetical protein